MAIVNRSPSNKGKSKKLDRVDLVDEMVSQLKARILEGDFASGELPAEGELSTTYGVSRTVAREAMRTLRTMGLVEVAQGKRPRVRPVDPEMAVDFLTLLLHRGSVSLIDLIEVRLPIEGQIAQLAALRATSTDIDAMEQAIRLQTDAASLNAQVEADMKFHQALAAATGNEIFRLLLAALASLLEESRRQSISRVGSARAVEGHQAILAAIRKRDAEGARKAMAKHLEMAREDLRKESQASASS
jgi:GntR family transcriptional repressor for pyruvate dehydrogenase complex